MPADPGQLLRFEHRGHAVIGLVQTNALMGEDGTVIGDRVLDAVHGAGGGVKMVALDLGRVTSVNSLTLGALVTLQATLLKHNVEFCLVGVTQGIRDLLVSTRLSSVFRLLDSREDLADAVG